VYGPAEMPALADVARWLWIATAGDTVPLQWGSALELGQTLQTHREQAAQLQRAGGAGSDSGTATATASGPAREAVLHAAQQQVYVAHAHASLAAASLAILRCLSPAGVGCAYSDVPLDTLQLAAAACTAVGRHAAVGDLYRWHLRAVAEREAAALSDGRRSLAAASSGGSSVGGGVGGASGGVSALAAALYLPPAVAKLSALTQHLQQPYPRLSVSGSSGAVGHGAGAAAWTAGAAPSITSFERQRLAWPALSLPAFAAADFPAASSAAALAAEAAGDAAARLSLSSGEFALSVAQGGAPPTPAAVGAQLQFGDQRGAAWLLVHEWERCAAGAAAAAAAAMPPAVASPSISPAAAASAPALTTGEGVASTAASQASESAATRAPKDRGYGDQPFPLQTPAKQQFAAALCASLGVNHAFVGIEYARDAVQRALGIGAPASAAAAVAAGAAKRASSAGAGVPTTAASGVSPSFAGELRGSGVDSGLSPGYAAFAAARVAGALRPAPSSGAADGTAAAAAAASWRSPMLDQQPLASLVRRIARSGYAAGPADATRANAAASTAAPALEPANAASMVAPAPVTAGQGVGLAAAAAAYVPWLSRLSLPELRAMAKADKALADAAVRSLAALQLPGDAVGVWLGIADLALEALPQAANAALGAAVLQARAARAGRPPPPATADATAAGPAGVQPAVPSAAYRISTAAPAAPAATEAPRTGADSSLHPVGATVSPTSSRDGSADLHVATAALDAPQAAQAALSAGVSLYSGAESSPWKAAASPAQADRLLQRTLRAARFAQWDRATQAMLAAEPEAAVPQRWTGECVGPLLDCMAALGDAGPLLALRGELIRNPESRKLLAARPAVLRACLDSVALPMRPLLEAGWSSLQGNSGAGAAAAPVTAGAATPVPGEAGASSERQASHALDASAAAAPDTTPGAAAPVVGSLQALAPGLLAHAPFGDPLVQQPAPAGGAPSFIGHLVSQVALARRAALQAADAAGQVLPLSGPFAAASSPAPAPADTAVVHESGCTHAAGTASGAGSSTPASTVPAVCVAGEDGALLELLQLGASLHSWNPLGLRGWDTPVQGSAEAAVREIAELPRPQPQLRAALAASAEAALLRALNARQLAASQAFPSFALGGALDSVLVQQPFAPARHTGAADAAQAGEAAASTTPVRGEAAATSTTAPSVFTTASPASATAALTAVQAAMLALAPVWAPHWAGQSAGWQQQHAPAVQTLQGPAGPFAPGTPLHAAAAAAAASAAASGGLPVFPPPPFSAGVAAAPFSAPADAARAAVDCIARGALLSSHHASASLSSTPRAAVVGAAVRHLRQTGWWDTQTAEAAAPASVPSVATSRTTSSAAGSAAAPAPGARGTVAADGVTTLLPRVLHSLVGEAAGGSGSTLARLQRQLEQAIAHAAALSAAPSVVEFVGTARDAAAGATASVAPSSSSVASHAKRQQQAQQRAQERVWELCWQLRDALQRAHDAAAIAATTSVPAPAASAAVASTSATGSVANSARPAAAAAAELSCSLPVVAGLSAQHVRGLCAGYSSVFAAAADASDLLQHFTHAAGTLSARTASERLCPTVNRVSAASGGSGGSASGVAADLATPINSADVSTGSNIGAQALEAGVLALLVGSQRCATGAERGRGGGYGAGLRPTILRTAAQQAQAAAQASVAAPWGRSRGQRGGVGAASGMVGGPIARHPFADADAELSGPAESSASAAAPPAAAPAPNVAAGSSDASATSASNAAAGAGAAGSTVSTAPPASAESAALATSLQALHGELAAASVYHARQSYLAYHQLLAGPPGIEAAFAAYGLAAERQAAQRQAVDRQTAARVQSQVAPAVSVPLEATGPAGVDNTMPLAAAAAAELSTSPAEQPFYASLVRTMLAPLRSTLQTPQPKSEHPLLPLADASAASAASATTGVFAPVSIEVVRHAPALIRAAVEVVKQAHGAALKLHAQPPLLSATSLPAAAPPAAAEKQTNGGASSAIGEMAAVPPQVPASVVTDIALAAAGVRQSLQLRASYEAAAGLGMQPASAVAVADAISALYGRFPGPSGAAGSVGGASAGLSGVGVPSAAPVSAAGSLAPAQQQLQAPLPLPARLLGYRGTDPHLRGLPRISGTGAGSSGSGAATGSAAGRGSVHPAAPGSPAASGGFALRRGQAAAGAAAGGVGTQLSQLQSRATTNILSLSWAPEPDAVETSAGQAATAGGAEGAAAVVASADACSALLMYLLTPPSPSPAFALLAHAAAASGPRLAGVAGPGPLADPAAVTALLSYLGGRGDAWRCVRLLQRSAAALPAPLPVGMLGAAEDAVAAAAATSENASATVAATAAPAGDALLTPAERAALTAAAREGGISLPSPASEVEVEVEAPSAMHAAAAALDPAPAWVQAILSTPLLRLQEMQLPPPGYATPAGVIPSGAASTGAGAEAGAAAGVFTEGGAFAPTVATMPHPPLPVLWCSPADAAEWLSRLTAQLHQQQQQSSLAGAAGTFGSVMPDPSTGLGTSAAHALAVAAEHRTQLAAALSQAVWACAEAAALAPPGSGFALSAATRAAASASRPGQHSSAGKQGLCDLAHNDRSLAGGAPADGPAAPPSRALPLLPAALQLYATARSLQLPSGAVALPPLSPLALDALAAMAAVHCPDLLPHIVADAISAQQQLPGSGLAGTGVDAGSLPPLARASTLQRSLALLLLPDAPASAATPATAARASAPASAAAATPAAGPAAVPSAAAAPAVAPPHTALALLLLDATLSALPPQSPLPVVLGGAADAVMQACLSGGMPHLARRLRVLLRASKDRARRASSGGPAAGSTAGSASSASSSTADSAEAAASTPTTAGAASLEPPAGLAQPASEARGASGGAGAWDASADAQTAFTVLAAHLTPHIDALGAGATTPFRWVPAGLPISPAHSQEAASAASAPDVAEHGAAGASGSLRPTAPTAGKVAAGVEAQWLAPLPQVLSWMAGWDVAGPLQREFAAAVPPTPRLLATPADGPAATGPAAAAQRQPQHSARSSERATAGSAARAGAGQQGHPSAQPQQQQQGQQQRPWAPSAYRGASPRAGAYNGDSPASGNASSGAAAVSSSPPAAGAGAGAVTRPAGTFARSASQELRGSQRGGLSVPPSGGRGGPAAAAAAPAAHANGSTGSVAEPAPARTDRTGSGSSSNSSGSGSGKRRFAMSHEGRAAGSTPPAPAAPASSAAGGGSSGGGSRSRDGSGPRVAAAAASEATTAATGGASSIAPSLRKAAGARPAGAPATGRFARADGGGADRAAEPTSGQASAKVTPLQPTERQLR